MTCIGCSIEPQRKPCRLPVKIRRAPASGKEMEQVCSVSDCAIVILAQQIHVVAGKKGVFEPWTVQVAGLERLDKFTLLLSVISVASHLGEEIETPRRVLAGCILRMLKCVGGISRAFQLVVTGANGNPKGGLHGLCSRVRQQCSIFVSGIGISPPAEQQVGASPPRLKGD